MMRNKVKIGLLVLFLIGFIGSAEASGRLAKGKIAESYNNAEEGEGIKFYEGDWQSALMLAKKENKLIFLDAYASWCGPCKMMERKTFPDEAVGAYFNANFVNVKMDMEKHPEGPRLATKFNLTLYPTMYFMQFDEELINYALGYHKPKQLLQVAKDSQITFTKM